MPDQSLEPTPPSMECEEALDLLHCLINNELEDEEAAIVLAHLGACKTCRAALAEHVKLNGLLSTNMPWLGALYFSKYASPHH